MKTPEHARPWWLLPVGRIHPLWWSGIGAGLIWIDYAVGPLAQFPVLYVIPVSLAAWYSGKLPALALATAVPLVHIMFLMTVWAVPGQPIGVVPTVFRGAVIVIMALWFARLSEHERSLHRYVLRLEGLLPRIAVLVHQRLCAPLRAEARRAVAHLLLLQEHSKRGGELGAVGGVHLHALDSPVLTRLLRGLSATAVLEPQALTAALPFLLHSSSTIARHSLRRRT